jgi:eukaryotic-like serine/threonine-protein kinase
MNELDLFAAAIVITDPAARAAFLNRECAGRQDLRDRLEQLVDAHFRSNELLDSPTGELNGTAMHHSPLESEGTVIAGRYKLLERIGEGGMGAVWAAEQTEPVRRKVALKLIKAGMDSKSVLARFEAERQALAVMDHPNIAKVLDGGLTDGGRPFFVMEYVKGVPITEYCDATRLSVSDRLSLFMQVCNAVQHAHQKGIIHRDLKPSNILVAPYDDKPVPKVIDFGLAKAMNQSLTERTLHTAHETVLGTPLYMSPEQAQLNNLDVDTRSDIYSLGVLLYELLTGTTPLEKQRFKQAAWDEIKRIIREEEPPRPSARLSSTATLPSLAASRQMEPIRLTKLVRGELDWIVMKALEKDRARRYDTANGFALDIQRYLTGEPIAAAPPSTSYRFKKFVRRNQGKVVAASLVFVALLAGIAGTTFGLVRANRAAEAERFAKLDAEQQKENAVQSAAREAAERKIAEEARRAEAKQKELAQAKEAEANALVTFFQNKVFLAARPKGVPGALGHDVSLRDAIRASLPSLGKSFARAPLVEARLRMALGKTLNDLGEHAQAVEQFEQARALYTRHRGPEDPYTLLSMANLAQSYAHSNRLAEALKLNEATLAARKRVLGPDHRETLTSMNNLAVSYEALNRHEEAVKLREAVLAAQQRVLPPDHSDTLLSMTNLAVSYARFNRRDEALKLDEEVLAARKRLLPADHPDLLHSMQSVATIYAFLDRHAEAVKLGEETLAARRRVLPTDHPHTLESMYRLAVSYEVLNRRAEAVKLFEETLAARKRVLALDDPATIATMHSLATSYARLKRYAEALELYKVTLAAEKRVLPPDDPHTLACIHGMALCYAHLNRHAEALPLIDELVAKAGRPSLPPSQVSTLIALRVQRFQKSGDLAECRASAEMLEKLNQTDAMSLYNAACCRAMVASLQAKAKDPDAVRLAKQEADKAMAWLTKAVALGYKDAAHMKKDTDLDALRDRADFKKLVADLETKSPLKKEHGAATAAARK